jgi:hypothetical protein
LHSEYITKIVHNLPEDRKTRPLTVYLVQYFEGGTQKIIRTEDCNTYTMAEKIASAMLRVANDNTRRI